MKLEFIAGKLIPFWIIAMADLLIGLLLAHFWFRITIAGNPFLLLFVAGIYLILILGFGLLVSTLTNTMQQAMFISWFFLLVFIFGLCHDDDCFFNFTLPQNNLSCLIGVDPVLKFLER